jgi:hypothetical protein
LDIAGPLRNSCINVTSYQAGIQLDSTTGGGHSWNIWSGYTNTGDVNGLNFFDNTSGSFRMVLHNNGNVLIGQTTVPSYNPTFVVSNNGGFQETTQIYSNNATSYNMLRLSTQNYVSSGSIYLMGFYNAGTLMGSIVSNGATNTTLYGTTSDARAKKNIDYTFDAMAIINQLKPASFNMLSDETDTVIHGFIAQDVLPIYPQYVITTQEDTYQMDYSQFMGIAIKAIQEQATQIADLQSQLANLIASLKK